MRKKLSKEYNLSIMNPSLAREWHTYRNRNITPSDVTPNQGLKVWWKCKYGHEWQSTIAHRNAGRGCPYCSEKKVNMDNCLETKYPRLAKEWHHFRNGRLTSKDVTAGSNKKVWWICNNGHEWQATISNRTKGSGCPYCSGRLADKNNSLLKLNHKLAKEWHPTLNNKLKSNDVRPGSSKKIWWLCSKGHEWEATVSSRNTGIGCPYCSGRFADDETCLTKTNPVLAKEWHPVKNEKITPNDVKAGSHLKVWWLCKKGHEWQAVIGSRNTGVGCPFCHYKTSQIEIRIFTEIKFIFEDASHRKKIFGSECDIYLPTQKIGIEVDSFYWHKNKFISDLKKTESLAKHGILLIRIRERGLKEISKNDIFYSSKEDVLSVIKRLIRKIGISEFIDRGKIFQLNHYLKNNNFANNEEFKRLLNLLPFPFPGYSLSDSNKELSKEWHPSKNIDLTPNDVYANAGLKVWWICSKGHEWQATIDHRNKGRGCPYCAGQKICVDNCLKTINPRLAKEWHPTKNGKLTPNDVTANTRRKVFWICIRGHVWKASIAS
ncbi:MAG: zinc-ribbon domain-containing protein, partial [Bacteroidales bacterium]